MIRAPNRSRFGRSCARVSVLVAPPPLAIAGPRPERLMGDLWDADGRSRYRVDDQGSHSRRRGDDPRSCRRWRPLRGDRDFGVVPRQIPRPAASDRVSIAAGPDGRGTARAGAADRGAGGLERFPAEAGTGLDPGWIAVRAGKTRQNKEI